MTTTTLYVCPFCGETITAAPDVPPQYARVVAEQIEIAAYLHLIERHPIRCRLSRRARHAIRTSRPVSDFRG